MRIIYSTLCLIALICFGLGYQSNEADKACKSANIQSNQTCESYTK